jgi:hypothetical protein
MPEERTPVERTPAPTAPAVPPRIVASAAPSESWHGVAGPTSRAPGEPPRSTPASPEPSPTAALLDAWVRLSRERPMLQLGAMLALALLFGLVFAALFAAAGGDERSSAPSADSAAVAGEAPPSVPIGADTTTGAAPAPSGARTRGAPARSAPAPSRREPVPERTTARPPIVQPRPRARVTPPADSVSVARPAVPDSAALARAREIEALREEFARSRARLDSINRSVDSITAPPPVPPPPQGR